MSPGTSTSLRCSKVAASVDRNLVTGAVDEQLGAVGGESEGETGPTVEFAAADKFAGWDVEGPELATAVPGSPVMDTV